MTADDYPSVAAMHHADYPNLQALTDRLSAETERLAGYRHQRRYAAAVMPPDADLDQVRTDLDWCIVGSLTLIDELLETWTQMTREPVTA